MLAAYLMKVDREILLSLYVSYPTGLAPPSYKADDYGNRIEGKSCASFQTRSISLSNSARSVMDEANFRKVSISFRV